MNNALTRQNDLRGFASSIQDEADHYAAGLAAKKNSYLNNVASTARDWGDKLDVAKQHLENADTLLRTGLEGEGAVGGAWVAAKKLKSAWTKKFGSARQGMNSRTNSRPGEEGNGGGEGEGEGGAGETVEPEPEMGSGGGGEISEPQFQELPIEADERSAMGGEDRNANLGREGDSGGGGESGAVEEGGTEMDEMYEVSRSTGRAGARTGVETEGADDYAERGLTNDLTDVNPQQQFERRRMVMEDRDAEGRPGQPKNQGDQEGQKEDAPETESKEDDAFDEGEGGGESTTGDAVGSEGSGEITTGGNQAGTGMGEAVDESETALTRTAEGGAEDLAEMGAVDTGLDEAAAATSWIPFIGEILGGAAAIASLGTAIAGGVEAIEAGNKEDQVQKQGVAAVAAVRQQAQTAQNVAGGYVAPTVTSEAI